MSAVREHLGLLWLSRRALMSSNPQDDKAWAAQAALFVGVHLNELIELAGGADVEGWVREKVGEIPADFPRVAPVAQAAPAPADWRIVMQELLEVCQARNSQGGAFRANAEGQRRIDAAVAILAAPVAQAAPAPADEVEQLDEWDLKDPWVVAARKADHFCPAGLSSPDRWRWKAAYMRGQLAAAAPEAAEPVATVIENIEGVSIIDKLLPVGTRLAAPVASQPAGGEGASKGDALWQAIDRACGELPEGYEVRIELENGAGGVVWYDDEGNRHVIDGEGYMSDDVNEAVDAALAATPATQQEKNND